MSQFISIALMVAAIVSGLASILFEKGLGQFWFTFLGFFILSKLFSIDKD